MTGRAPTRTCAGCGTRGPKDMFFRVVRDPDGCVRCDPGGRSPGRGAYLCRQTACVNEARRRASLQRALKVSVSDDIYEELEKRAEGKGE